MLIVGRDRLIVEGSRRASVHCGLILIRHGDGDEEVDASTRLGNHKDKFRTTEF